MCDTDKGASLLSEADRITRVETGRGALLLETQVSVASSFAWSSGANSTNDVANLRLMPLCISYIGCDLSDWLGNSNQTATETMFRLL